jgi:hypothetical protein
MFGSGFWFRFGSGFGVRFGAALAEPGTDTQETNPEPGTPEPRTWNSEPKLKLNTNREART